MHSGDAMSLVPSNVRLLRDLMNRLEGRKTLAEPKSKAAKGVKVTPKNRAAARGKGKAS